MTNQIQLNNYFGNVWRQKHFGIEQYQYTGFALIDKIQEGERVIDIGCGANPFKGHLPN